MAFPSLPWQYTRLIIDKLNIARKKRLSKIARSELTTLHPFNAQYCFIPSSDDIFFSFKHYELRILGTLTMWRWAIVAITCPVRAKGEQCPFCILYLRMAQGVIFIDDHGRAVEANPAAEQVTGLSLGRLQESDIRQLLVHEDGSPYPETGIPSMIALRTGGEVHGVVLGIRREADDSVRWVSVSAFPVQLESGGKEIRVCLTFDDITETVLLKKKLEKALARERKINLILQKAIAPERAAQCEGYQIADKYTPIFDSDIVGGDAHDSFMTRDGKLCLFIADVSGKGLKSVSIAQITRSTVRAFAWEISSPAQTLSRANEVMCSRLAQRGDEEVIVTVCMIVLDPPTGVISYANAGHPPPLIWRQEERVQFLRLGQLPFGICTIEYQESTEVLQPGDKILLYTDGVTEARRDGIEFGEESLRCNFNEYGRFPAGEIVDQIDAALFNWTRGEKKDDATMMVLARND